MRHLLLLLLLIAFSSNLNSQETNLPDDEPVTYNSKTEYNIDWSLRLMFSNTGPSFLTFGDMSAGIGFGIIPGFWYLGIAGDVAIGTDWFLLFSDDDEDSDEDDIEFSQFGLSIGGRIYSKIKVSNTEIVPFFGCDFMFVVLPLPYIGIELFYNSFGIEYAYYLSNFAADEKIHQVSIKIRI